MSFLRPITTAIALIAITFSANAQSDLAIINPTNTNYWIDFLPSEFEAYFSAEVENTGGQNLHVLARRQTISMASGHMNSFCWESKCYGPSTDVAGDNETVIMAPNDIETTFKGILTPSGNAGQTVVKYCFFDTLGQTDSICMNVTYDATWSIEQNITAKGKVSQAFPSPANDQVSFGFDLFAGVQQAEFTIYNASGQMMGSTARTERNGVQSFDVSRLANGLYFARIKIDGEDVAQRKFVVSH